MAIHGGCDCGAVRYVLSRETLPGVICCHCHGCQTRSGSAFDQTAFIGPDEIVLTGEVVNLYRTMRSGNKSTLHVCASCHTLIYNTNSASPVRILLRAGTLDDSRAVVPVVHMFTAEKQAWLELRVEVPAYAGFPPAEEFARILAG